MDLTSKVANRCGSFRNKRSRSLNGDASIGPPKSPFRDGMDRTQALKFSRTDLDDIPVSCQEVTDAEDHSYVGVRVPRHTRVVSEVQPRFN